MNIRIICPHCQTAQATERATAKAKHLPVPHHRPSWVDVAMPEAHVLPNVQDVKLQTTCPHCAKAISVTATFSAKVQAA